MVHPDETAKAMSELHVELDRIAAWQIPLTKAYFTWCRWKRHLGARRRTLLKVDFPTYYARRHARSK